MAEFYERLAARRQKYEARIGADLHYLRTTAPDKITQEDISTLLGHEKMWLSRVEHGKITLSAAELILLGDMLRRSDPDHPLVTLYDYYTRGPGSRRVHGAEVGAV